MAQESIPLLTVIHFTGTRNSSPRHFALQILVFQYVFSPQDTVVCLHSLHIYPNTTTMELASSDDGGIVVMLDSGGGISFDMPVSIDNVISFMKGMKLGYNDGNGVWDIVTFLGMDYVDDMQMVCHIQQSDGTKLLAVPPMLNFIENPDIAFIPQTNEEYYDGCNYLDPSDL